MSEETSQKFESGNVSGTVTFRHRKKPRRFTIPITEKWLEEHPENAHWMLKFKKKETRPT